MRTSNLYISIALGFLIFFQCLFSYSAQAQFYDGYGQNNVQDDYLEWKNYDTSHFRVFYYGKAKNLALLATNLAEDVSAQLVKKLKVYIDYKANLVLYTSYNHYKQSNRHQLNNEIILEDGSGVTLTGKTYMVYYDGNIFSLRKQIEESIIRGFVEDVVYGDFIKNMKRYSFAVDIPYWFSEGLVKYVTDSISSKDIEQLKSYTKSQEDNNLFNLAKLNPELAGKFFWDMIYQIVGEKEAIKLLNKSVSTKSYYKALRNAINADNFKTINNTWDEYIEKTIQQYDKGILTNNTQEAPISIETPRLDNYSNFSASPLKDEFLYVQKSKNSWDLYNKNKNGKVFKILSGPQTKYGLPRDKYNPILAWSNNGQVLGIVFHEDNRYKLKYYNSLDRSLFTRNIKPKLFDRVLHANFTESSNNLLLSVIKNDRSDIVLYTIKTNRVQKITDDDYVDLEPIYLYSKLRKGLVWISNRENSSIQSSRNKDGNFQNLYYNIFYKDAQNLSKNAQQLTNYKESIVSNLTQFGENAFSFFVDSNHTRYRMILEFEKRDNNVDTFKIYELPSSEYPIHQQYIRHTKENVLFSYSNGKVNMYKNAPEISLLDTVFQSQLDKIRQEQDSIDLIGMKLDTLIDESQFGNYFMSEFYDENKLGKLQYYNEYDSISYPQRTKRLKISSYLPNFYIEQSQLELNNDLLVTKYQDVASTGSQFYNIPLSEMYSITISDVLKDYTISGGFRFNFFELGSEAYVRYINRKRKLDWSVIGYRKSNLIPTQGKIFTYYLEPSITYPFNDLHRLTFSLGGRADMFKPFLTLDTALYGRPEVDNTLVFTGLEYVYDDSYVPEVNIRKGVRAKISTEFFNNFRDNNYVVAWSIDARAYLPVHKNIIWANRISTASSYGNSKILYFIGGTDNPIVTSSIKNVFSSLGSSSLNNQLTVISPENNYILQTRSAPLRGYKQNERNGNSYFLFNTELRVPIASTFINRPINSVFFRSLQFIIFADVAMTWIGNWPNSNSTASYIKVPTPAGQPTIVIKNPYDTPPIGFGTGLRAEFWGTYTKLDLAWKSHDFVPAPFLHLSLGYDF